MKLGKILTMSLLTLLLFVAKPESAQQTFATTKTEPVPCFTCYIYIDNCWFWNCSTITHCSSGCPGVSADGWRGQSTCYCGGES